MSNNIYNFDGADRRMIAATKRAQKTFKYFWREVSWERRRIVPGFNMMAVKVAFVNNGDNDGPSHEHMWVYDVDFNGKTLKGILMNSPEWVTHLKPESEVEFKLSEMSDWMITGDDQVLGAFTVNVMREDMSGSERRQHDAAWGLNFGDPLKPQIFYKQKKKKSLFSFFKKEEEVTDEMMMKQEHPMCLNMAESFHKGEQKPVGIKEFRDDDGNNMIHLDALAGNAATIKVYMDLGMSKEIKNDLGLKPIDMAKILKWDHVIEVLRD